MSYAERIKRLLSPAERRLFERLDSPERIQNFLEKLPTNPEHGGHTILSPRRVLKARKAHCLEGALLAAAAFAYHGERPLLLDFQSAPKDDDHCVALFKRNGLWGAISKTSHAVLRFRDPVYRTVRELAMSYFHEYLMPNGAKTLKAFSTRPFDLRRYKPEEWITREDNLEDIEGALDWAAHSPVAPKRALGKLRRGSAIERKALKLEE